MDMPPLRRDRRTRRGRFLRLESLESRSLLTTTETFAGPSLSDLIQQAQAGQDTAPAAISRMEKALKQQLVSGPLADLTSGAVDGDGFVSEVQSLESSYEQELDQQLSPEFPAVNEMLDLQGEQVVAAVVSLNQQNAAGLLSSADLASQAKKAIDSLTSGPINALNTPLSGYTAATQDFVVSLAGLVQGLGSTTSTPLTVAQAVATAQTEAQAYQSEIHAGLEVEHPYVSSEVDTAVSDLESTESAIASDDASTAATQLDDALATFGAALLGSGGVFGATGAVSQAVAHNAFTPNPTMPQAGATLSSVSGTATPGGPATLTATLTAPGTGQGVAGETVAFTLDGAFAGLAVTDSDGVATLSGVPTSDAIGIDSGGVVASFAGDVSYTASEATGDLTVDSATTLGNVSGTATYGGTATLTATLTSTTSGQGVANETVSFTLDGTAVGTAVTDSNGVATLAGVATSDAVGTDTGGVVASFAGDSSNLASTGTGNLVVSQAPTTLGSVSGTATYGGTASLTATLTSTATGAGISGETVSFTLDGTSVGTAVTNSSGVATLTGVATSDAVGTDSGGVVASFAGDTNNAASSGTGDLVVSPAPTSIASVSGTASGGTASLTATLTSTVTGAGLSGQTVSFTLDGTSVGSTTTDSSGVATLTGVTTGDAVGTDTNGVVASYAGGTDYDSTTGTGNLVVTS